MLRTGSQPEHGGEYRKPNIRREVRLIVYTSRSRSEESDITPRVTSYELQESVNGREKGVARTKTKLAEDVRLTWDKHVQMDILSFLDIPQVEVPRPKLSLVSFPGLMLEF